MYQRTNVKKPSMFAQSKNPQLLQKQKSQEYVEEERKQLQFPLFSQYSKLMKIPKVDLQKQHTRIRLIPNFGMKFGIKELYIKRDDVINDTYGGNKVRKFEFLLGYALSKKVKTIIGLGGIGSNCCVCEAALSRLFSQFQYLSAKALPLIQIFRSILSSLSKSPHIQTSPPNTYCLFKFSKGLNNKISLQVLQGLHQEALPKSGNPQSRYMTSAGERITLS